MRRGTTMAANRDRNTPASESYHPYLLSQLADPAFATVYLEPHFEEAEEAVDPELLTTINCKANTPPLIVDRGEQVDNSAGWKLSTM